MKARALLNCLVNWEKIGSSVKANIKKTQFSISSMNWGKLRGPAMAIFNNLHFQIRLEKNLVSIGKNRILNPSEILRIPQNF